MTKADPFKYFYSSHEIIRLAVTMYVRFPLSLRNVEDLLHERGIDISHETVRYWWNRFGSMFAAEIRRRCAQQMRAYSNFTMINEQESGKKISFHVPALRGLIK
jgi:putative transposase